MNFVSFKAVVTALALSAIPALAIAQAQPQYRIRTLELDVTYEGNPLEYKKINYEYYNDRRSVPDWDGIMNAFGIGTVKGFSYDNAKAEKNSSSAGLQPQYTSQQAFDNSGRISQYAYTPYGNGDSYIDTFQYDGQGNVTGVYRALPKNSSANKLYRYYYNTSNRLDSATVYYTNLNKYYTQEYYSYDNQTGLLKKYNYINPNTSSTPSYTIETEKYYTYDVAGRVMMIKTLQSHISTPIDTLSKETFEYNTAGDVSKYVKYNWHAQAQAYLPGTVTMYDYDGNRNLLQKLRMLEDTNGQLKDTTDLTSYTYNVFGLPSVAETKKWSKKIFPQVGIYDTVYKVREIEKRTATYELFWPTSIDAHGDGQAASVTLYPVPAGNELHITARFTQAQTCTATVTDLSGKLLRKWHMSAAKEQKYTLLLEGMPAGTYLLQLQGDREVVNRTFVVQ